MHSNNFSFVFVSEWNHLPWHQAWEHLVGRGWSHHLDGLRVEPRVPTQVWPLTQFHSIHYKGFETKKLGDSDIFKAFICSIIFENTVVLSTRKFRDLHHFNFTLFVIWFNIIDLPGGQIIDLLSGNTFLFRCSQQLPRLYLGPLNRLLRCFRNYKDTMTPSDVLRARRGGPRY